MLSADEGSTTLITGAHAIIYSTNPDADRAFLRDILQLTHVDVGGGWLIFGLPPSEVAVHPADQNDRHELYLMCDDVEAFVTATTRHGLTCGPVQDQGWGRLTQLTLPGGGRLGVYEPRHARPAAMPARKRAAATKRRTKVRKTASPTRRAATRAHSKGKRKTRTKGG